MDLCMYMYIGKWVNRLELAQTLWTGGSKIGTVVDSGILPGLVVKDKREDDLPLSRGGA